MTHTIVIPVPVDRNANCEHNANPTPAQTMALSWLAVILDTLRDGPKLTPDHLNTEADIEMSESAAAAGEAVQAMAEITNRLHRVAHDHEDEIARLTEALRITNQRCDTLELLVKD